MLPTKVRTIAGTYADYDSFTQLPEEYFDRPAFAEMSQVYADFIRLVAEEDREMMESLQNAAMRSRRFIPGPTVKLERAIHHLLNFYLDALFGQDDVAADRRREDGKKHFCNLKTPGPATSMSSICPVIGSSPENLMDMYDPRQLVRRALRTRLLLHKFGDRLINQTTPDKNAMPAAPIRYQFTRRFPDLKLERAIHHLLNFYLDALFGQDDVAADRRREDGKKHYDEPIENSAAAS